MTFYKDLISIKNSISDIDQLITISGMVIRLSPLIPEMREAFFQCYVCHNSVTVEIERGRIAEPTLCTNCNTNHSFALVHNRSQFSDKQMIKLQESPGLVPVIILCLCYRQVRDLTHYQRTNF